MISARIFFSRMNENRNENWLTEDRLLQGTKEFFESNYYSNIEYNKVFDQGARTFSSPIVAYRVNEETEEKYETIVCIFKSQIKYYELSFFGYLESILFDILDSYEQTNLMLVTDSLSYMPIIKTDEISVIIENMMKDGLYVLFINQRYAYALFDKFEDLTKPVPIYD
jgi:hypothetical protein